MSHGSILQVSMLRGSLLSSRAELGPERAKQTSCQEPAVSVKAEPTAQGAHAGTVLGVLGLISIIWLFELL